MWQAQFVFSVANFHTTPWTFVITSFLWLYGFVEFHCHLHHTCCKLEDQLIQIPRCILFWSCMKLVHCVYLSVWSVSAMPQCKVFVMSLPCFKVLYWSWKTLGWNPCSLSRLTLTLNWHLLLKVSFCSKRFRKALKSNPYNEKKEVQSQRLYQKHT
jgi:hypothetical protein